MSTSAPKKDSSVDTMEEMTEEEKRGPGRPKLDPAEKVVRVSCYVAPEVAEALEALARAEGERVGPWLAAKLTKIAKRGRSGV